jgi:hypothetical protein
MATTKCHIFNQLVSGFYESDLSFLQELDLFCIYIDNEISNGYRSCYVLAKKNNDIIINEPTTVKLTQRKSLSCDVNAPRHFDIEFRDLSDEITDIFPIHQIMKYYPMTGKIILYNQDEVTFVGYKHGMNTEMKSVITEQKNKKEYDE